jgi:hypothetical protein
MFNIERWWLMAASLTIHHRASHNAIAHILRLQLERVRRQGSIDSIAMRDDLDQQPRAIIGPTLGGEIKANSGCLRFSKNHGPDTALRDKTILFEFQKIAATEATAVRAQIKCGLAFRVNGASEI